VFIIAEEPTKDRFRVLQICQLKDALIEENLKQKQFTVSTPQTKILLTYDEKSELLSRLKEAAEHANTTGKVFGVPLVKLLEREKSTDGIPFVVKTTIAFLKLRKQTEGLFRISGGSVEVSKLKEMFNKIEENPTPPSLTGYSPHSIAAILKMFFRELPEPLLTYDGYKPFVSMSVTDVSTVKAFVKHIPKPNQVLMKYLASFLCSIASYESVNKMTLSNLATVFGPNLLYPREETLENILAIPKLNSVIQFIIQHHESIFD